MNVTTMLELMKARLGIRSTVRDTYLEAIIKGVVQEVKDKGVVLDEKNPHHLMFIVDYSTWSYQSVTNPKQNTTGMPLSMPRHLQWRLHNLVVGGVKNGDI